MSARSTSARCRRQPLVHGVDIVVSLRRAHAKASDVTMAGHRTSTLRHIINTLDHLVLMNLHGIDFVGLTTYPGKVGTNTRARLSNASRTAHRAVPDSGDSSCPRTARRSVSAPVHAAMSTAAPDMRPFQQIVERLLAAPATTFTSVRTGTAARARGTPAVAARQVRHRPQHLLAPSGSNKERCRSCGFCRPRGAALAYGAAAGTGSPAGAKIAASSLGARRRKRPPTRPSSTANARAASPPAGRTRRTRRPSKRATCATRRARRGAAPRRAQAAERADPPARAGSSGLQDVAHGSAPSVLRSAPPVVRVSPGDRLPGEAVVRRPRRTAVRAGISHPFSRMVSSMSSPAASFRYQCTPSLAPGPARRRESRQPCPPSRSRIPAVPPIGVDTARASVHNLHQRVSFRFLAGGSPRAPRPDVPIDIGIDSLGRRGSE